MRSQYTLKNASIFLVSFLTLSAQYAPCQEPTGQKLEATLKTDTNDNMRPASPWNFFAGVGGGYSSIFGQDFNNSLTGSQFLISGLLSYELNRWVFDGGASWIYNRVSGVDTSNREVRMRTRSGTIDFSPRYRLTNHWQLGPSLNVAFGTDTSFSPSIGDTGRNYFAGIRSVYETYLGRFPFRFWQQVSTDVTIRNRQSLFAMVGIQLGLPFSSPSRSTTQDYRASGVAKQNEDMNIVLDPQLVFFGTNSAVIRPEVKTLLRSLAQYLKNDESNWSFVEISGHADQRGQYDYNLKLSKQRALAVRDAIEMDEVTKDKVKVEAYSYLKPLDNRNNRLAWAKNRRVELTFHEVKDQKSLSEKLAPLSKLTTPLKAPSDQVRPYTEN